MNGAVRISVEIDGRKLAINKRVSWAAIGDASYDEVTMRREVIYQLELAAREIRNAL